MVPLDMLIMSCSQWHSQSMHLVSNVIHRVYLTALSSWIFVPSVPLLKRVLLMYCSHNADAFVALFDPFHQEPERVSYGPVKLSKELSQYFDSDRVEVIAQSTVMLLDVYNLTPHTTTSQRNTFITWWSTQAFAAASRAQKAIKGMGGRDYYYQPQCFKLACLPSIGIAELLRQLLSAENVFCWILPWLPE